MGDRLSGRSVRQHPDLTGLPADTKDRGRANSAALRSVVLTLLAIDGVISAIFAALFLQVRLGSISFPISALISGLVNAALVWAGLQWTSSLGLGAVSLWAWLLTIVGVSLGGPGGDRIFGGPGFDFVGAYVLLVVGAIPPLLVLSRHRGLSG